MENATRTVYGSYVQTCLLSGKPVEYKTNTTVNEKLGINPSILPATDTPPSLSYYIIGNGGHQNVVGANGIPKTEPIQHRATDASLYNQLPFVLRALNNDLATLDRTKYCLRKQETHNSVQYIAYYGRRLDKTNMTPGMTYKVTANGVDTITPFVPNSSNLNPTPPTVNNVGVNTVDGSYVTASAPIAVTLTADDVAELANVATILYNDSGYAIISEIGLCTGVDKYFNTPAPTGSGNFQFQDAIGVQIISHIPALISADYANNGVNLSLAIGSSEPLLNLNS